MAADESAILHCQFHSQEIFAYAVRGHSFKRRVLNRTNYRSEMRLSLARIL
jgi:hypothetical protein